MGVNEQECDFNALVEACAGPDRKEQTNYLVKVVMKIMIEFYGRNLIQKLPDANVLLRHSLGDLIGNGGADIELLDAIYLALAKSLLGDVHNHPSDIRSKVKEYMLSELRRRQVLQQET